MANRLSDTEIWTKDWYLELNTKQKLLVKFLFDNCDCAGFYKISWHLLKFYFNDVEITLDDFKKIKQVKFIEDDLIFIEDFALFQCKVSSFDKLNPNNKAHLGVLRLLKKYGVFDSPLKGASKTLQRGTGIGIGIGVGNTTNKQEDNSSKLYGEYLNVNLSKEQYGKLLAMCTSEKLLNELINSFSIAIEVGKERPYNAALPNAHYERLKSYYNYRKKNPDKFVTYKRPEMVAKKPEVYKLTPEEEKKAEEARIRVSEMFYKNYRREK